MRFATLFEKKGKIAAGTVIGIIVWILMLPLHFTGFLESFELKAYDRLCQFFVAGKAAPRDIVLVAVDQGSLDAARAQGINWPWPRQMYAPIVRFATRAGAKAVVFDILYTEPSSYGVEDDDLLAEALRDNGHVYLPVFLSGEARGEEPWEREIITKTALPLAKDDQCATPGNNSMIPPVRALSEAARGFGNVKTFPDTDGIFRRIPPAFCYRSDWIPAIGLAAFRDAEGGGTVSFRKDGMVIGGLTVPLDGQRTFLLTYYDPDREYQRYSAYNVISSALALEEGRKPLYAPESFKDKIVFIGFTAPGLFDMKSTPVSSIYPGVSIHATLVANLLQKDFRTRISPPAVFSLSAAVAVFTGITVMLAGGYGTLLLTVLCYTGGLLAFILFAFHRNLWVDAILLLASLGFAFAFTAAFSYATEGRHKRQIKQTFSHYMSDLLIQDLLRNPEKLRLGGERRVLSVFFSDLAGFTSMSEMLSPEEVVGLLNKYLTAMTDIILESGGIIDKYEGDAIMAFWGSPVQQEDHAARACLAALDNQERLVGLREEFQRAGLPPVYARIGINTGEMIIGNMGSSKRFDFTVIGDSVNLASRLEGAGKEYGTHITISEETWRQAEDRIEVRELDLLQVKGKEKPVRIYEVLARSGALDDGMKETARLFTEGLVQYRAMRWDEAVSSFRQALAVNPGDGPSKTFIQRCEAFMKDPPPAGWDGVYRLTTK
ncbi:MAG: adenylate/guanylate cyclase domain-containing protein [Deltaproteobacteria bacterium]|nr:adenylate/guanylate cyclase domain-containing protein [Deltaproteobacteria bacterium]